MISRPTTRNGQPFGLNSLSALRQTYRLQGTERFVEELHFLPPDLIQETADERKEGEASHPFSLCPPRKCFPEPRLGASSIADLPRVMGTMIVDSGRRSFPDKSRASTKSPRHFPAHYRHPERIGAHRDRREKQLPCSYILHPPHPLGQRPVGEVEPPMAWGSPSGDRGLEMYKCHVLSPSRTTASKHLQRVPVDRENASMRPFDLWSVVERVLRRRGGAVVLSVVGRDQP